MLVFNTYDRLATLTTENNTTTYHYGAERDRIAKQTAGYTHLYPSPYTEYTRNGHNDALMLGATRLATVDDTTTRYHVKDHLQSTSLTIGEDGSLHEAIQYTPYGAERERQGTYQSTHTYTDQIKDYESTFMYYNARYYSPTTRTFTSGDPVAIMEPETVLQTPQLLNPYSYVGNNPVAYTDPTGEAAYHFANGGGMTGIDYWDTGVYTEGGDRAILMNNASLVSGGSSLDKARFVNNVRPGGIWDYKDARHKRSFYIYDGKLVTDDEFGNINYGSAGASAGFSRKTLGRAGATVQGLTTGRFSEPAEDVRDTSIGYNAYSSGSLSGSNSSGTYRNQTTHTSRAAKIDLMITALKLIIAIKSSGN